MVVPGERGEGRSVVERERARTGEAVDRVMNSMAGGQKARGGGKVEEKVKERTEEVAEVAAQVGDELKTGDEAKVEETVGQLRKHDATKKRGELETLPNVGLQLFDVVTVTDARAGVSSEVYRVRGIEERYDTTKEPMVYGQRVGLGGR